MVSDYNILLKDKWILERSYFLITVYVNKTVDNI